MTSAQEQSLRDGVYTLGNFIENRYRELERKNGKESYWTVSHDSFNCMLEGRSTFSSYGEAKSYLNRYIKQIVKDLEDAKPDKDDRYTKDSKKLVAHIFGLEGDAYERAIIELRDVLIETGHITIAERQY